MTAVPALLSEAVEAQLADWDADDKVRRLWSRDASLWTGNDEARWLGWLDIADEQLGALDLLRQLGRDAAGGDFDQVLLLGMGGSSLCPEVLRMTFGRVAGSPELNVLDSTDPAQVRSVERRLDLSRTLFIVSSKSGSTLEPNIFQQYFFHRVQQAVGPDAAGERFVAITDPGSELEHIARRAGFRHVVHGVPSIGGRYSALSPFGTVPAAVMGLDVERFLRRAQVMRERCSPEVPVHENPGAVLGLTLGTAAAKGHDKITIVTSPGIWDLGAWLEQLVAESTGKLGKGLIPVDGEPIGKPDRYTRDRLFVYLRDQSAPDTGQDAAIAAFESAGHPVVRLSLADRYDIGGEFFRWEFATAVAGAVLGINPFDQPDVEASKVVTRQLTAAYEKSGVLPSEDPVVREAPLEIYVDRTNAAALGGAGTRAAREIVAAHLARLAEGDYLALLAYVEMNGRHRELLQEMRLAVRDAHRVATCLGFGPRFLHSTGQAYKGGPNNGVFLQITCDDAEDVPVPGRGYSFGVVKAAQARGDFQVLVERGRRALRLHVTGAVETGLERIGELVAQSVR